MCIIMTQMDTTDKLGMRIAIKDNIWQNIGLTLKSPVESPSYHNGFPLDLGDLKTNGAATDLFCTGVIGHPGCMLLN